MQFLYDGSAQTRPPRSSLRSAALLLQAWLQDISEASDLFDVKSGHRVAKHLVRGWACHSQQMLTLILLHVPDTAINAGLLHSAGLPHTADNSQYAALQVTASLLRCKFCLVIASMLPPMHCPCSVLSI